MSIRISIGDPREFKKMDYKEFIINYDVLLSMEIEEIRWYNWYKSVYNENDEERNEPLEEKDLDYNEIEKNFIQKINAYFIKRNTVINKYREHCEKTNKHIDAFFFIKESSDHNYKFGFLEYKLKQIDKSLELEKKYENIGLKNNSSKSLLVKGRKLNLLDRFGLANNILNMEAEIRKLNIKDLEKYKLVALILGCNEDNARDLMNGKYNAKSNDLTEYYKELGLDK